ncbi:hypothetical protein CspeluHIS016_0600730 [Cutaneotrichosporon spelunceum]|uniref:RlpA-like protein double-psi beta-barrel domain-containing protein n=1 Tax=Cutaneotrichosporon spelunceum TaxID=1672016 RepID=A0AAD3TXD9_9TREE|nr:hypothetical protein CspeluHIS016_0600730 [Cutaneotrichosporon spelunceum]
MKLTTFALFTAIAAVVTAAPTPEAHRGGRHGHKYGGQRKYGHSHKQPQADAPAVTDEWDENEPCLSDSLPPVANKIADASSAAPISSSSAVSSSEQATPTTSDEPKPEPTKEAEPPKQDEPKPEPPKQDEPKPEPPKEEPKPEPPKEESKPKGGSGVGANGGARGHATTYSVTNPSENHGMSGKVACYTLGRDFSNSDHIAAVRQSEFSLDRCGKMVNVCGAAGCLDVMIVDSCVGGGCKELDITPSAFKIITGMDTGVPEVSIVW